MSHRANARHGVLGIALGLVALAAPGLLAVVVGTLGDVLPAGWLAAPDWMSHGTARAISFVVGIALLIVAGAYLAFRRIGWLGYMAWGLVALVTLVSTAWPRHGPLVIAVYPAIILLGLPYLWARRRDFGIGADPTAGMRR